MLISLIGGVRSHQVHPEGIKFLYMRRILCCTAEIDDHIRTQKAFSSRELSWEFPQDVSYQMANFIAT
jgi:hypothetical protein